MTDQYDVLIKGAMIVDGTGAAAFVGDIGIRRERIVALGAIDGMATAVIDGTDLVASPGFIDPHSHADLPILSHPTADNLVRQGITTFVGGNCGVSLAPVNDPEIAKEILSSYSLDVDFKWRTFGEWLTAVAQTTITPNYAPMVGHDLIRVAVMGRDFKREATAGEVEEMMGYVQEAMESGAFGLSSFFDPGPGEYAALTEIVELAKVAGAYGGMYVPHTRHVQSNWPSDDPEEIGYGIYHGPIEDVWVGRYRGYLEAIEISRQANLPLHISHLLLAYRLPQPHPEFLDEAAAKATLAILDEARADGVDVTFDVIAYAATISGQQPLITAFSRWEDESGKTGLMARIRTAEFKADLHRVHENGRLKLGMIHTKADPFWMDCFKIVDCANKAIEGKTLTEIIANRGTDPLDTLVDILREDMETMWVQFKDKRSNDASIATFLKHPLGMPCTDTTFVMPIEPDESLALSRHGLSPVMFGLYPHYIQTYVKEKGILTLEEAIQKATSWPAERFGLTDRGILKEGAYADVVLFDLDRIRMVGDFDNPAQAPEGIEWVLINGRIVIQNNAHTCARPGMVIKRE